MSPRTPADRLAAAATWGCPASQAATPSADSTSPAGRPPVAAQAGRVAGGGAGERGEPLFQQRVDGLAERVGVIGRHEPSASTSSSSA